MSQAGRLGCMMSGALIFVARRRADKMEEKLPVLKAGLYKAEHTGDIFHAYRYVMEVKATEKSYIFRLMEKERRYDVIPRFYR